MVCDAGASGIALKCQDVTLERRGELPILFSHVMGRQPGDGVPGCVLVLKSQLELLEKVVPGSKGYGGASDGIFSEGVCPGQGGPFSHIREGEDNLLHVIVVGHLIDC